MTLLHSPISRKGRSVTAILISRFLIDLQRANIDMQHGSETDIISCETLAFNRAIGSLGSHLPAPGESASDQILMFEEAEADDVIDSRSAGSADRIPFNQKHLIVDAIPTGRDEP
ncbi:hypothetical protein C8Q76DRAFT_448323 [Earliella scabrosa]|nr:hypothetical protein C8Q76DRAFT_448323 [Earliella scabrosa]